LNLEARGPPAKAPLLTLPPEARCKLGFYLRFTCSSYQQGVESYTQGRGESNSRSCFPLLVQAGCRAAAPEVGTPRAVWNE